MSVANYIFPLPCYKSYSLSTTYCVNHSSAPAATPTLVSSVVEHSSANPKVPGSIPGPVSYRGHGL